MLFVSIDWLTSEVQNSVKNIFMESVRKGDPLNPQTQNLLQNWPKNCFWGEKRRLLKNFNVCPQMGVNCTRALHAGVSAALCMFDLRCWSIKKSDIKWTGLYKDGTSKKGTNGLCLCILQTTLSLYTKYDFVTWSRPLP